jgi:uncharacterized protein
MNYKLSFYTVISEFNEEVSLLWASRTSKSISLIPDYADKLKDGRFSSLPITLFEELLQMEAIVPEDEDELQTIVDRTRSNIIDHKILSIAVLPSANCQLGCGYCGQSHSKKNISDELEEKILARTEHSLSLGLYETLEVAWFGGEPLMGLSRIYSMAPKLMQLAEKYNCKYISHMTTNGMSLKKEIFFELNKIYKVNWFEITLDGTAEYHNAKRHTKEKYDTFDIILNNAESIVKSEQFVPGMLNIRCNVDRENHEGVSPLMKLLVEKEIFHKVKFYTVGVYSWGNDAHTTALKKEEYAEMEIGWLIEMFNYGKNLGIIPGVEEFACYALMPHTELYDAYGNVYDCSEIPLVPSYKEKNQLRLGTADHVGAFPLEDKQFYNWPERIKADKNLWCSKCKMLPVCGGSCPKQWHEGRPACPSFKFNMEDRIALTYMQYKDNEKMRSISNEVITLS